MAAERRTAETPVVSTVHSPIGNPAGPGLWHHKGLQLPAYIQNVAKAFMRSGTPESEAIARAVGVVRDWAQGRTPNGHGHVHPDVQAAAAKAIAEWDALKAGAGRSYQEGSARMGLEYRAAISTADQNDLPDSDFAFIEPGGTKDSSGKTTPRSLRHFPVHDAAHVRNALARAPQSPFGDKAMPKIKAAAAKLGVDVSDSDSDDSGRSYEWLPLTTGAKPEMRGVDDAGAQRIGGYAAVFGKLSRPLRQGPIKRTFVEMVDRGAFNESRSRGWKRLPEPMTGFSEDVLCRLNHQDDDIIARAGRTLDLAVDSTGLDYTATPMPEHRSLQMVRRGDIQASSFMFNCDIGVGDHWELTDQEFPMRVLDNVDLIDVAPVTSPAYPSATAGLRSLAAHFGAELGEVRSMAAAGELTRFFVRTDNRGPAPAPVVTGPQAMMRLMEKRFPKI